MKLKKFNWIPVLAILLGIVAYVAIGLMMVRALEGE